MKYLSNSDGWVQFGYCNHVSEEGYPCRDMNGHPGDHDWFKADRRGAPIPPIADRRLLSEPDQP